MPMLTRRKFLIQAAGAGFALAAQLPHAALAQTAETERNKQVVLGYKTAAKTQPLAAIRSEFFSANYKRTRSGLQNLANNAAGQDFADNGEYLRGAIPDRNDVVEEIVAEGDMVGMLWRVTGTHRGPLFGIPPTGKQLNFYEAGMFKLAAGKDCRGVVSRRRGRSAQSARCENSAAQGRPHGRAAGHQRRRRSGCCSEAPRGRRTVAPGKPQPPDRRTLERLGAAQG